MSLPALLLLLTTAAAEPAATEPAEACAAAQPLYERAFEALSRGQEEQALEGFEQVLARCPTHPYAGELARLVRTRLAPTQTTEQGDRSRLGRAELVVVQTLHGGLQGVLWCGVLECEARPLVALSLLGAGTGAAGAWYFTRGGVTAGQALAINSGTAWGLWYGFVWNQLQQPTTQKGTAMVAGSGLALTGLSIAGAIYGRPTAGQVSMGNSGGLWAGALAGMVMSILDVESDQSFYTTQLLATSGGIALLYLASDRYPVSRGRMLLIDSGGIIGGLVGAAAVVLLLDPQDSDAVLVGSTAGVVTGLATAAWLTRRFDAPEAPAVTLLPAALGGGPGVVLAGRF
jgi:hypothetical protein